MVLEHRGVKSFSCNVDEGLGVIQDKLLGIVLLTLDFCIVF